MCAKEQALPVPEVVRLARRDDITLDFDTRKHPAERSKVSYDLM